MARFKVGYENIEGLVPNFTQKIKFKNGQIRGRVPKYRRFGAKFHTKNKNFKWLDSRQVTEIQKFFYNLLSNLSYWKIWLKFCMDVCYISQN